MVLQALLVKVRPEVKWVLGAGEMTCDDESLATFLPQMTPEERVELCSRLKSINFWGCLSHTSIEAA